MEFITHGAVGVIMFIAGFWARKYIGKKDPAALAAADAAVKQAGEEARRRF